VALENREIFEIKLGDEYLMSSLFTRGEEELAILGLSGLDGELDVVVGGLGLGYTAAAVLKNPRVRHLLVIELFPEVIGWHRKHLVPLGPLLSKDPRCEMRHGNFFELAAAGFETVENKQKFDAVLLDIDHSPKHYLDNQNGSFYTTAGLRSLSDQIKACGSFALWSNDPADERFTGLLRSIFGAAAAHTVEFPNPYTNSTSVNSVYIARKH
jgi:spermidine synthase